MAWVGCDFLCRVTSCFSVCFFLFFFSCGGVVLFVWFCSFGGGWLFLCLKEQKVPGCVSPLVGIDQHGTTGNVSRDLLLMSDDAYYPNILLTCNLHLSQD